MIDCYVYIALGMTADSYADLGGSAYFHQASSICALGQSNSAAGWAESQGADFSRTSFVEELLNPRFETIRHLAYSYYHGRDILTAQPDSGYKAVVNVIDSLVYFKQSLGGTSLTLNGSWMRSIWNSGNSCKCTPTRGRFMTSWKRSIRRINRITRNFGTSNRQCVFTKVTCKK